MGTVTNLSNYKRKFRKVFLAKHGARIDRMVEGFLRLNVDCDFVQLAEDYQSGQQGLDLPSWDYIHFREILAEALDQVFGNALYDQLRMQPWFDSSLIRRDEVIDLCLSTYVLGRCNIASK